MMNANHLTKNIKIHVTFVVFRIRRDKDPRCIFLQVCGESTRLRTALSTASQDPIRFQNQTFDDFWETTELT